MINYKYKGDIRTFYTVLILLKSMNVIEFQNSGTRDNVWSESDRHATAISVKALKLFPSTYYTLILLII